ncbi:nucleoporin Nup37 [Condylostylus longicornis]|uniref:nucleoporin Nup37 n=1 Tax=Condylostylus longicornis TaxID=2530218 RepID=UPI00244E0C88|nr:nucleoporin Nup37 [Condylostylus longicornis]
MRSSTPPTHLINLKEQIYCFEICGNDFAHYLIGIAVTKKVVLALLKFPEETETESFEYLPTKEIYHESRCHAIAFSPSTSLACLPKVVMFCTAGADFILRIFRSDLQNSDTVQELKGHTNYVNDLAWEPEGEFLASVSDDHSCRIWSSINNFESVTTFCLNSAGMSVKWHPEEPSKVLVAEKNGIIHLYNAKSQQVILSLESPKTPLMSADWSLHNRMYVAALCGGDIITWDLRRTCRPADIKQIHEDGGRIVKISPNTDQVTASVGRPDITLKVLTAKSQIPLIESTLKLYGGLAWHSRLPYVAAAFDRKLCFWKVQTK